MVGYNFTDRVRVALQMAREEATRLRHPHVDADHILLGSARKGDGIGMAALQHLGTFPEQVVIAISAELTPGTESPLVGPDLSYTSSAKEVPYQGMQEAGSLGHDYVGTTHVLLGVLRTGAGIGVRYLATRGVGTQEWREPTIHILEGKLTPPLDPLSSARRVPVKQRALPLVRAAFLLATSTLAILNVATGSPCEWSSRAPLAALLLVLAAYLTGESSSITGPFRALLPWDYSAIQRSSWR